MPTFLDWPLEVTPSAEEEYDRFAHVYDLMFGALASDIDFYVKRAREILPPGGEILELGAGTGRVAERLIEEGFRVIGVDVSEAMLAVARSKCKRLGDMFEPIRGDVRTLSIGRRFRFVIAPFGMMAHLLTEEERMASLKAVFEHLEPGGVFIFDDLPDWVSGPSNGEKSELQRTAVDPETGQPIRLMRFAIDIAGAPLTLVDHKIDWLDDSRLLRRLVVRVVFRNTPLEDELRLLSEAGFENVELLGAFDGRPFHRDEPCSNERFIIRAQKPT